MKKLVNLKTLFAVAAMSVSSFTFAGFDTETDNNSVILAGHDAVAYFTENKAVVGSAQYTTIYNDAIYRFSSAQNRDTFAAAPSKYAPAYGGFCAYGTTFGKKFEIDGKAFEVRGRERQSGCFVGARLSFFLCFLWLAITIRQQLNW